ncbi:MAG: hypothetical protein DRH06_10600, partial [Deltaproteobacteria bacterium]
NTAYFDSIGKLDKDHKPLEAGTILYLHNSEIIPSFRTTNGYDLDFYNGTGMVFLPTAKNTTKSPWKTNKGVLHNQNKEEVVFKDMPTAVLNLLELMKHQPELPKTVATTGVAQRGKGFLAKVLENVTLDTYQHIITKILTPKEYRSAKYAKQGHLHPNDIAEGASGHMYLFKIATILATDNTVDKDLFRDVIDYINDLWDEPYPSKKLESTIIAPIISGRQLNPQGEPYFEYDEAWDKASGYSVITKRDSSVLEVFFDNKKMVYYLYDIVENEIRGLNKRGDLVNYLKGVSGLIDQKSMDMGMQVIHTYSQPTRDFGFYNEDRDFNLFKSSQALKIMNDPSIHKDIYKTPKEFIAYIENFIPSEPQRDYFLQLLRTKLTTFKYSPVVPYIIGVQGSGKNTIMTVLQNIMGGTQYVKTDVGGEQFLEKYNSWLMDTYFVQLNELGDTVTSASDKKKAQGILKNYTGSEQFECRAMHTDSITYPQTAMFIMTANQSPLTIEDTDRRLFYISTPNTFDHSPQCLASDPITVYEAIMAQTDDIAYWLATAYPNLQKHEYVRSPEVEGRQEMIFGSLNNSTKIAWALSNSEFDLLMEWLVNPLDIFKEGTNDRVLLTDLASAYTNHSNTDNPETVMKLAMKAQGFKMHFGSHNIIYYDVPHLNDYDGCRIEGDDEADDIELEEVRT